MGFLDKLQKIGQMVEGANDVADTVGRNTVVDYGEPAYSLYTALELGSNQHRIDIYQPDQEAAVVAIVVQLEKMLEARREDDEHSSSSSFEFGIN